MHDAMKNIGIISMLLTGWTLCLFIFADTLSNVNIHKHTYKALHKAYIQQKVNKGLIEYCNKYNTTCNIK